MVAAIGNLEKSKDNNGFVSEARQAVDGEEGGGEKDKDVRKKGEQLLQYKIG